MDSDSLDDLHGNVSTRERLLGLIDDIELLSKELLENVVAVKPKRLSPKEQEELTLLLIAKDKEIKETLKLATEQAEIEKKIEELQEEVKHQDDCIKQLQKQFKDVETILSTAVFQARQKLDSINKARQTPVNSEDLIRYAHRISASNAVCAPLNWEQGDPRRPYPTDLEMRLGFLGRGDAAAEAVARGPMRVGQGSIHPGSTGQAAGGSTPDFHMVRAPNSPHIGVPMHNARPSPSGVLHPPPGASPSRMGHHAGPQGSHGGQFAWHGGEMTMIFKDGSSVPIETGQGQARPVTVHQEEVEVMSTDSSSSSSTDSN